VTFFEGRFFRPELFEKLSKSSSDWLKNSRSSKKVNSFLDMGIVNWLLDLAADVCLSPALKASVLSSSASR